MFQMLDFSNKSDAGMERKTPENFVVGRGFLPAHNNKNPNSISWSFPNHEALVLG